MKDAYRIAIKRPGRKRAAYLLLVLGALCLYVAASSGKPTGMKVESSVGVLVTREETLPAQEFFLVSLYNSADEHSAMIESARYAARGASGSVLRLNGLYHAVGAVFGDMESAETSAQALSEAEQIDARAISAIAPEVLLHITATQQQLSALLQADAALCDAAEEFGDIAAKIDGGEVDLQGAQGLLYAQASRLKAMWDELSARAEDEPVCALLIRQLSDAHAEAQRLADLDSVGRLQLSSSIRCLQVGIIGDFCAWRAGLAQ